MIARQSRLTSSLRRIQCRCLSTSSRLPSDGRTLHDFLRQPLDATSSSSGTNAPSFYIKTYGCQMNVNDTDIVRSILLNEGFSSSATETDADVILTNTCAIRDNAERKVWHRLRDLRGRFGRQKVVGVLGCMAERLQEDLLHDGLSDLVVGPDAYRDLPRLVYNILENEDVDQAINVQLSMDETYEDILPFRQVEGTSSQMHSAFVSIQRGCSNRCSFCIVPFTRGQERSRPLQSILDEVRFMVNEQNLREVTLLGQNVNSYHDQSMNALQTRPLTQYQLSNNGFRSRIRRDDAGFFFADLLAAIADIDPELRVRFTSPHPKDYPSELLELMAERHNVCSHLHMPAQSGSTTMLKRMKRGYSREAYMHLIDSVKSTIPDVAISSDFIAGFCGETEEEHQDTLSLLEYALYDQAYMFAYSSREKTYAHRVMKDDVPEEVKQRRLREIIDTFHSCVQSKNEEHELGKVRLVLLEGQSKRSTPEELKWHGRTDQNKRIVFPVDIESLRKGEYAAVRVTEAKGHTLRGKLLGITTASQFYQGGALEAFESVKYTASARSTVPAAANAM